MLSKEIYVIIALIASLIILITIMLPLRQKQQENLRSKTIKIVEMFMHNGGCGADFLMDFAVFYVLWCNSPCSILQA